MLTGTTDDLERRLPRLLILRARVGLLWLKKVLQVRNRKFDLFSFDGLFGHGIRADTGREFTAVKTIQGSMSGAENFTWNECVRLNSYPTC